MEEDEKDPEIQTTITQSRPGHSQILHVRQDSANELDHLFTAALNPNNKSKSLPMKLRKLPKSFFQQPDRPRATPMHAHSRSMGGLSSTVSHSRSSSTDSSASHHSNLNLSSSNLHQQSPIHANTNLGQRTGNFTPGPVQQHHPYNNAPGHNMGLQVPQISHSRSKSSPASLPMMNTNLQMKVPQQNNTVEIPPDMPLPQGWEFAKTPDGQTYFMNHTNRTTTWNDPRIAILKEQLERANAGNMQPTNHPQSPMHINNIPNEQSVAQQPLPPGWEQATTPQGEIYFINHETRTTSWIDPRSQNMNLQHANQTQMNAQIQHQLHKMNQLDLNPRFGQQRGMGGTQMIKHLAREKELMQKMRQQEMLKQSGTDPFLGSSSSYHERDSSRDAGMGGNFNHPRATEEYLEEMETDSGNHNQQVMSPQQQQQHMANVHQARQQHAQHAQRANSQQQSHFPDFLDTLPASSVDFGNDSNNQQSNNLNEEELVPSISETLTTDFMNDVESMLEPVVKSENMDNMTWL